MKRLIAVLLLALLVSGCASSSWNPLKWVYGRKAHAVQTQEAKQSATELKSARAATVEVYKSGKAIERARLESPDSRPVEIAARTNSNALQLLQQVHPLTVADQQEANEIVEGLLSAETKRRIDAEAMQSKAEKATAALSGELDAIRAKLLETRKDAADEAAKNLDLANELRIQKLATYAGAALSALLSIAAIAYKLNIGRFQQAAGELLAKVGAEHGEAAEGTARLVFDDVLHTAEKQQVFKIYSAITAKK